jgi:hypothetical protein
MGDLLPYDEISKKLPKKTKTFTTDTPPNDNPRLEARRNIVRHSSLTDVFNAIDPRKTATDITEKEYAKGKAARQFIKDFEEGKREKENARRKTFGEKQLERTTDKYTNISASRKEQETPKQGGKYSRIKRKMVTRKGMRKTRAKSKKNNKKHYKRR